MKGTRFRGMCPYCGSGPVLVLAVGVCGDCWNDPIYVALRAEWRREKKADRKRQAIAPNLEKSLAAESRRAMKDIRRMLAEQSSDERIERRRRSLERLMTQQKDVYQ